MAYFKGTKGDRAAKAKKSDDRELIYQLKKALREAQAQNEWEKKERDRYHNKIVEQLIGERDRAIDVVCGLEDELAQANRRIEELEAELKIQADAMEEALLETDSFRSIIEGLRTRAASLVEREDVIEALTKRYELVSESDIRNTVNSVPSAEQCCEGTCDKCGECKI